MKSLEFALEINRPLESCDQPCRLRLDERGAGVQWRCRIAVWQGTTAYNCPTKHDL